MPPTCICDKIPLGGLPGHLGRTAAVLRGQAADPREVTVEGDAAKRQVCSGHKNKSPLPPFPHLCHPYLLLASALPPPHQCLGEQPGPEPLVPCPGWVSVPAAVAAGKRQPLRGGSELVRWQVAPRVESGW